jgi:hypothetical protein
LAVLACSVAFELGGLSHADEIFGGAARRTPQADFAGIFLRLFSNVILRRCTLKMKIQRDETPIKSP